MKFGIEPDIAVFSKALGYPISAIVGTSKVMNASQSTFISSTNWTERIGPVAAIATITKHLDRDVSSHLVSIGGKIQNGWKEIAKRNNIEINVSGIEPLSYFSFQNHEPEVYKSIFVELMLQQNFLASTSFYAMYSHTDEQVEEYLFAVNSAFQLISEYESQGLISSKLVGKPAAKGFTRLT